MSTNDEFEQATNLLISCRGSVSCGCEVDDTKADLLYYQCQCYVVDYRIKNLKKQLVSYRGSVSCGCEVDDTKADWLYYQCKCYIADYRRRFMNI